MNLSLESLENLREIQEAYKGLELIISTSNKELPIKSIGHILKPINKNLENELDCISIMLKMQKV